MRTQADMCRCMGSPQQKGKLPKDPAASSTTNIGAKGRCWSYGLTIRAVPVAAANAGTMLNWSSKEHCNKYAPHARMKRNHEKQGCVPSLQLRGSN
eukprot:494247-Amphidinium_carterae.1